MHGDRAARAVTAQAARGLLESLVAVPSPSGREAAAADLLVSWMRQQGMRAAVDEVGNAVGAKGDGPNEVLLLGHIDTFPGVIPVRRDGDYLHGRGAVDAKGALCAFAVAAARVAVPAEWRLTVVGAVEEEAASSRGARHVLARRQAGQAPRFCVIGEPSRWDRITLAYKGCLRGVIALRYPYAHSAGTARLPAEAGVELWHAVERWCAGRNRGRPDREFHQLRPSLLGIDTRDDGTHGAVTLRVAFRLGPEDEPAETARVLSDALERTLQDAPAETSLACDLSGGEAAHRCSKATPLVGAFLRSVRARGGVPRFVTKTGTSDMNVVGPAWPRTPMVAYGPGDSALDHTPGEHLDLTEYDRAIDVLGDVFAALVTGAR